MAGRDLLPAFVYFAAVQAHSNRSSQLKRGVELAFRIALLGVPLILLVLPSDFFDRGPVLCPSKRFLGVDCPGCGLTRATQHFLHGEWDAALSYNPLVLVAVPILALLWFREARNFYRELRGGSLIARSLGDKRASCGG